MRWQRIKLAVSALRMNSTYSAQPAQHHHEGPDGARLAFKIQVAVSTEIDLCLFPDGTLEPWGDAAGGHQCPPKWADELFDHGVLAHVPTRLHLPEEQHGTENALLDPALQVRVIRIELATLCWPGFRHWEGRIVQVLLNGVAAQIECAGNAADAVSFGVEFDDLAHLTTSEHVDLRFLKNRRSASGCLPRWSNLFRHF